MQAHRLRHDPLDDPLHVLEQLLAQWVLSSSLHDERDGKHELEHARLVVVDGICAGHGPLHEARARSCLDEGE